MAYGVSVAYDGGEHIATLCRRCMGCVHTEGPTVHTYCSRLRGQAVLGLWLHKKRHVLTTAVLPELPAELPTTALVQWDTVSTVLGSVKSRKSRRRPWGRRAAASPLIAADCR